ncbi:hypothetical protein DJ568_12755 [Mucilaginibacter hurinus]|uniref:Uncharacterized protein n=1 Tax=Mucilaginibacter hurinus TaxID=2201324 RepID=A0A367GPR2_9SPHI|nr:hypothetical protein [Mucilaginibacter hurinus]RCH54683.1 hypothetical protein DJ568_12755 [Mucilaginibacter hurinus]
MSISKKFPDFDHEADELSKYIAAVGMVTIMLKDGSIIHYTPKNIQAFLKWLADNKVKNIKSEH